MRPAPLATQPELPLRRSDVLRLQGARVRVELLPDAAVEIPVAVLTGWQNAVARQGQAVDAARNCVVLVLA